MRRGVRPLVGVALAVAVTLAVAALSRVSYAPPGSEDALLRLSWRVRGERVEECRHPTGEELEALPVHMRRAEVCEGRVLPYHLHVELDGRTIMDDTVRAAGAREDRPIYVYHEVPVGPGVREISVRFVQAERGASGVTGPGTGGAEVDGPAGVSGMAGANGMAGAAQHITPARLELSASVDLLPGDVVLVTYDPDRRELVTRLADPPAATGRP